MKMRISNYGIPLSSCNNFLAVLRFVNFKDIELDMGPQKKRDTEWIQNNHAGFLGENIAGMLTTACLKTSRRVVACDIFSQKSMLIIIDLHRNCKHENADTNNFDEIHFVLSITTNILTKNKT